MLCDAFDEIRFEYLSVSLAVSVMTARIRAVVRHFAALMVQCVCQDLLMTYTVSDVCWLEGQLCQRKAAVMLWAISKLFVSTVFFVWQGSMQNSLNLKLSLTAATCVNCYALAFQHHLSHFFPILFFNHECSVRY